MTLLNDAPITGSIVSVAGQVAIPINGFGNVGLFMTLTGVNSGQFAFEASIDSTDGVNGNWFAVLGLRSNATALESATGQLFATPTYGWQFDVTGFNYFRVRATAGIFGTTALWLAPGDNPKVNAVVLATSGNVASRVQGAGGRNAFSWQTGDPIVIGATGRSTNIAQITDTRPVDLWADLQGKLIVKPFSPNELDWQVLAAAGTPITTATTTLLKAAIATYRQYVTAIQLVNNSATGTEIALQDTTGTPVVIWRSFIGANAILNIEFPTPLRTGSGTASGVSLVTVTAGCSIWWAAQGFISY